MTELHAWYGDLQVARTAAALRKNNFDVRIVPGKKEALREVIGLIPENSKVGVGGSMTLTEIGFFEEAEKHSFTLLNPSPQKMSMEEFIQTRRKILLADVFLSSSNAVTEEGELFNIDATGNRTGAMAFGPKQVILVCGFNKITRNLDGARKRVREWVAPMNAKRLGLKTPCAETGMCGDCSSPQRICNIFTVLAKKPSRTAVTVILVGEHLGL
ncbi:MAG TPA: lactate utilization protein [Syntrophorhabdaceae bacterium]|jgi:hypothetical protein